MSEEKTIAPRLMNARPDDPDLVKFSEAAEALAQEHGYAMVAVLWKPEGKMAVIGVNLKEKGGTPGRLFASDPSEFFTATSHVLKLAERFAEIEKEEGKNAH